MSASYQLKDSSRPRALGASVAFESGEGTLTFDELSIAIDAVAHQLHVAGIGPTSRVALDCSSAAVGAASLYAVLTLGAAYVPFDSALPDARRRYMLEDSQPDVVVLTPDREHDWLGPGSVRLLRVTIDSLLAGTTSGSKLELGSDTSTSLAYIIYTSGTTGRPKGVAMSTRSVAHFIDWCAAWLDLSSEDRVAGISPLHFDMSVVELIAAHDAGATVVAMPSDVKLFPKKAARWIRDEQITALYVVPSFLVRLLRYGGVRSEDFARLRLLMFAGEPLAARYVRQLRELAPNARLVNAYGPTEANITHVHELVSTDCLGEDLAPIGKPITGVREMIEPISPEEPDHGELLVAGPTLMTGYWRDTERTARAFSSFGGDVFYRTGDLVRRDRNGELVILGRVDRQVKTSGYRVELDEIEGVLLAYSHVDEAAVAAVTDEEINCRLVALVVGGNPLDLTDVARFCAERLPRYAIPRLVQVASLPRTTAGKVDRNAVTERVAQAL